MFGAVATHGVSARVATLSMNTWSSFCKQTVRWRSDRKSRDPKINPFFGRYAWALIFNCLFMLPIPFSSDVHKMVKSTYLAVHHNRRSVDNHIDPFRYSRVNMQDKAWSRDIALGGIEYNFHSCLGLRKALRDLCPHRSPEELLNEEK